MHLRCAVLWFVLGAVSVSLLLLGPPYYRHRVVHERQKLSKKHQQPTPNPEAIAGLGRVVVPELCMTIADLWESEQGSQPFKLVVWLQALGDIGDSRAVPTLIALTDDPNPSIRRYALLALWKITDSRALPALRRLRSETDAPELTFVLGAIDAAEAAQRAKEGDK